MKHCCQNCPNYDPWERSLPGGYNDEDWPAGEPISEEEQKKILELAGAFGKAASRTVNILIKNAAGKVPHKEAEKENKNRISKYNQSVSFTKKDLFGGETK